MSNIIVKDLMSENVITARATDPVGEVKRKMSALKIRMVPVVSGEDPHPVGVVTARDLLAAADDHSPVSDMMREDVYTVPEYESVHVAARIMRNHRIHHVPVTRDKSLIGIISSFDLLRLVEGRRFEMKNPATPKGRGRGRRARAEL